MTAEAARFLEFGLFFIAAIVFCAWEVWKVRRSQRDDASDKKN